MRKILIGFVTVLAVGALLAPSLTYAGDGFSCGNANYDVNSNFIRTSCAVCGISDDPDPTG